MVNKVDALARLKNRIRQKNQEEMEQRVLVPRAAHDPIDYKETRAFSGIGTVYGTINLNVIGRDPDGTVPKKEAEALKDEIIGRIENVKDPVSGEAFINKVCRKEEIFKGDHIEKIPDLVIIPNTGYYLFAGTQEKDLFHKSSHLSPGNHIEDGILLLAEKDPSKFDLSCADITDMLPTILNIFKIKVPEYLDGKSLLLQEATLVRKN